MSLPPRPHARVIGMNTGVDARQVMTLSSQLGAFASVSWDGDQVKQGAFTEGLARFLKQAHEDGSVAQKTFARCQPGQPGTYTQGGSLLPPGVVPRAQPLDQDQYDSACQLLNEKLGANWRKSFAGEMEGYMALAAAHCTLMRPDVVFWLLDEQRSEELYGKWACLGEYMALAHLDPKITEYKLIAADGHMLTDEEISSLPWASMTPATLGWA